MTDAVRNDGITVRPLVADNLAVHIVGITKIYGAAVRETVATVEHDPPSVDTMNERISRNLVAGYPAFVAVDAADEHVVGYAYTSAFRKAKAFRPAVEHSIYIDQSQRGRGVGRQLLVALIDEATSRDFRQMIAVIEAGQLSSLVFHEALGFVEVGRMPSLAFKQEQWCTAIFMQLALGEGGATPPDIV